MNGADRIEVGSRVRVTRPDHCCSGGHGTVIEDGHLSYDRSRLLFGVLADGDAQPWWLWNDEIELLTAIELLGDVVVDRNQR